MQIAGIDMVIGQKYTLTMCVREGGNRGVTQIRKKDETGRAVPASRTI